MTFDELEKTWRSQQNYPTLTIDPNVLLKEVKRNKDSFESAIFRRDLGEIGTSVGLVIVFLYFGIRDGLWPLCLLALLSLWVGVFMVADRMVQKKRLPSMSDSLFNCIKSSLAQINHQVWLLKNVLWWYLLPVGVGLMIWFGYCGISVVITENDTFFGYLMFACIVGTILLYWGIYWLNQRAIRKELVPRKQELEDILVNLENGKENRLLS